MLGAPSTYANALFGETPIEGRLPGPMCRPKSGQIEHSVVGADLGTGLVPPARVECLAAHPQRKHSKSSATPSSAAPSQPERLIETSRLWSESQSATSRPSPLLAGAKDLSGTPRTSTTRAEPWHRTAALTAYSTEQNHLRVRLLPSPCHLITDLPVAATLTSWNDPLFTCSNHSFHTGPSTVSQMCNFAALPLLHSPCDNCQPRFSNCPLFTYSPGFSWIQMCGFAGLRLRGFPYRTLFDNLTN